jgi:hypothetical protein
VVLVRDSNAVKYQTYIAPPLAKVGDIAYWNGNSVKTVPLSNWKDSLGTPIGVVMIGENFLPDGKARIISLTSMNNGNKLQWDTSSDYRTTDSSAPNFNYISGDYPELEQGILPSDRTDTDEWLNGPQSQVDLLVKYYSKYIELGSAMIPSPYLGDKFNPAYSEVIEGGNALSDFNGLSNTLSLVNEGTRYAAANACWNYKDNSNGVDGLQWYLPAMGELGFLMPRFQLINQSIQAVGGTPVENNLFLSSSEYYGTGSHIWGVLTTNGMTGHGAKNTNLLFRAVSIV